MCGVYAGVWLVLRWCGFTVLVAGRVAWAEVVYVSVQVPVCWRLCGYCCSQLCTLYTYFYVYVHVIIYIYIYIYIYVSTIYRLAVCGSAVAGFVLCVFSVCVVVRKSTPPEHEPHTTHMKLNAQGPSHRQPYNKVYNHL